MDALSNLPTPALIGLGLLVALQLALQITAIVALVRTPAERLTLPRVAWVIIILLGELIGAIVFLAAGRRPAVDERAATVARPDAIEELYR